jgi:hypothetical protein
MSSNHPGAVNLKKNLATAPGRRGGDKRKSQADGSKTHNSANCNLNMSAQPGAPATSAQFTPPSNQVTYMIYTYSARILHNSVCVFSVKSNLLCVFAENTCAAPFVPSLFPRASVFKVYFCVDSLDRSNKEYEITRMKKP